MPSFLVVVLVLAAVALVAMRVISSRKGDANPRRRSKQRAKREDAPRGTDVTDDAPRMPMGDVPPRVSHRRH